MIKKQSMKINGLTGLDYYPEYLDRADQSWLL